jgi:PAS domain S-box-containing protein
MPQIVWVSAADGGVELVNRVLCQYTGLDPVEALKNGWMDAIHPDDRIGSLERWNSARTSAQSYESEVRIRRADGEYRWFLARAVPQRDAAGTIERWIGTATDIDDQRRNREVLTAAVQAKDDFLAAASHELRTPLAAAKAQVQLTTRRLGAAHADEATVRSLKTVGSQIDRMTRLVEDLLDVSRLQTGRLSLHLAEYDLSERIRGEVERIQALSPTHELNVDIPETLSIIADRDRIDQVVINLLTNAVRYSPGGGPILIAARPLEDLIQVTVADRGVGIPEEKKTSIFERFGRAHGARYGGLGLGLTIAQGIIEQHGGRIWVESSGVTGEGSTFRFELPLRAQPRPSII